MTKKLLKIEILKKNRGWYFRIKARNGRILAHSEQYSSNNKAFKSAMLFLESEYYIIN